MNLVSRIDKQVKGFIHNRFFYNEHLQGLVWKMYYTPDKHRPGVPISAEAEKYLYELRENGITAVPGFEAVADHLDQTYFSIMGGDKPPLPRRFEVITLGSRAEASNTINYRLFFNDPGLAPLVFNPDVCGILYNYYQRQPFYRQQPWAIKNAMAADTPQDEFSRAEVSAKFHVDCYRQITLMLLVNELTVNDTHLQFAIGSHKFTRNPWDRYKYKDTDIVGKYPIFDAVGPKGTLIIMDAGCGIHRGLHKRGSVRKTLQLVVTTGHYINLEEPKMTSADQPALDNYPDHVRHIMDQLVTH